MLSLEFGVKNHIFTTYVVVAYKANNTRFPTPSNLRGTLIIRAVTSKVSQISNHQRNQRIKDMSYYYVDADSYG